MTSQELFERSLKVTPGGVHSPVRAFKSVGGEPLFFKSTQGPYITSVEGQRFIDYCQSFGPLILGHRDPDIMTVVKEAFNTAWTFGTCEPYSLELAEWIVDNVDHVERVRFVNSGTEAVMSALRVARAATKKDKILKFEGCYHGHVDSLLVKAGSGLAGLAASDSAGVSQNVASETLVAPLGDRAAVEQIFKDQGDQIAAIIIEPLPANFGLLIQEEEFLQFLRKITDENNSLLIFDEVISGFRISMGGMAEETGITPDLVTYGKVIGGGFPVGCYAGKKEFMDLVAPSGPVYQAGTLSGNPIGMMAGLATLVKMKKNNVIGELNQRTTDFRNGIMGLLEEYEINMKIINKGSLMWFHSSEKEYPQKLSDIPSIQGEQFKTFFHHCLSEDLYFAPSGFEVAFMSWAHDEKIMVDTMLSLKKVFTKMKESE